MTLSTATPEAPIGRTLIEAGRYLRCSPGTVRAEIRRGNLRASLVANKWLISQEDLDRYVDSGYNVREATRR